MMRTFNSCCVQMWTLARPFGVAALLAIISSAWLSGCASTLHLNNPQNAKLADELVNTFDASQEDATNVFTVMRQNLESAERVSGKLLDVLSKTKMETFAVQIHSNKWKNINGKLATHRDQVKELQKKAKESLAKLLAQKEASGKSVDRSKTDLQNAKKLLKEALVAENLWMARHELWRASLGVLSDSIASGNASFDLAGLDAIRSEILSKEIEIRTTNSAGEIVSDKTTLKDLFKDELKEVSVLPNTNRLQALGIGDAEFKDVEEIEELIALLGLFKVDIYDPKNAPGLKVLLLNTAVDLADVEVKRGQLEISHLDRHIAHWNQIQKTVSESFGLTRALALYERLTNDGIIDPASTVLDSLNYWKLQGWAAYERYKKVIEDGSVDDLPAVQEETERVEEAIQELYELLIRYSVMRTVEDSELTRLSLRPLVIDHEYSIALSAVNAQERVVLIRSGLEGLRVYHAGGVKPEDIANLLRVAQTIALGFIAGN